MERDYDLRIDVRPVYPLAVRFGEFFDRAHPLWAPYLMRDTIRIAEMLGLPYRWPRPDPVTIDPATRKASANQPYIHRLTRLGCAAAEIGRGLPFLFEVSRAIWSGVSPDWSEGDLLTRAAERAGCNLVELDLAIAAKPEKYEATIAANQDSHTSAGHWGVPTMVFENEPFFGQDRLDMLLWRLKQRGLAPRAG
jgi:2-hydroxychromene-2-carboxylate isomerase